MSLHCVFLQYKFFLTLVKVSTFQHNVQTTTSLNRNWGNVLAVEVEAAWKREGSSSTSGIEVIVIEAAW